jgi:nitrogen fixation NifU-like protein
MISDLYQAGLVKRARDAFGHGRLPSPSATVTLDNPLCGDRVTLDIQKTDDTVTAIGHEVRGCLLCEAAAATIAESGRGLSPAALKEMSEAAVALLKDGTPPPDKFEPLRVFTPVHGSKSRRDCVLLPFEALRKALDTAF